MLLKPCHDFIQTNYLCDVHVSAELWPQYERWSVVTGKMSRYSAITQSRAEIVICVIQTKRLCDGHVSAELWSQYENGTVTLPSRILQSRAEIVICVASVEKGIFRMQARVDSHVNVKNGFYRCCAQNFFYDSK